MGGAGGQTQRSAGGLRRAWVATGAGLVLIAALLPVDAWVIEHALALREAANAWSKPTAHFLVHVTQLYSRAPGVIACVLLLSWLGRRRGRGREQVASFLLAVMLASLAAGALKMTIGRARPGPAQRATGSYETLVGGPRLGFTDPQYRSFPSGHTTAAAAASTVISACHPGLAPIAWGLAALVGAERVYDGKHYPSDVVAGVLTGYWVATGLLALRSRGRPRLPWERSAALARSG